MAFVLSKVLWILAAPGNALVLLLVASLFLRRSHPRTSRALVTFGTLGFLLVGWLPVGTIVLAPLENRFPVPATLPDHVDGVVVLGGTINSKIAASRNTSGLTMSAERLTAAVILARRFPSAKIVVTGGSGDLIDQESKEAPWAEKFLVAMGVEPSRIVLESESRNTFENAVFTQRLIKPRDGEHWLLVTSAFHMPRSVGCFRRIGWTVIPYPVDFHTVADAFSWRFDLADDLSLFSWGAKEWVGLVAYRALDRTTEFFPAP